jgi:hypothetical protein
MIFILSIMSISLVSSAVIISGKTYDPSINAGNELSGVNVVVACTYNGTTTTKNTDSKSDGSYGIGFNSATLPIECTSTDNIDVSFTKSTRYGDSFSFIVNTKSINVLTDYFILENLVLDKTQTTPVNNGRNSGSGGREDSYYYNCGNGLCNDGESIETCPQDCVETQIDEETESEETEEITELDQEPEEATGFFGGITGAVVGTLGVAGTWIVGVFLVGLVGMSITVRQIRRKKRLSK